MITLRWAAITVAVACLVALTVAPRSLATALVAGLFFICFAVVGWTCGAFERNRP